MSVTKPDAESGSDLVGLLHPRRIWALIRRRPVMFSVSLLTALASVAAMQSADVDLVIVSIPKSEPPTVIERVAEAISK